ncbi:MAG: metallophosphoesterase family protein [Gaiellales bacterium]
MRAAVISDVHSNLPALEAVLEAIDAEHPDELWCLGDLVGYGAEPRESIRLVLDRAQICLAGNHDLVVAGAIDLRVFAHAAAAAARWTMDILSEDELETLRRMSPSGERAGVEMHHGSVRDPVWEYVIDDRTAEICMELQHAQIALVGHSHVPLAYAARDGRFAWGGYAPADEIELRSDSRYLFNPGSVGQPRDGDPRAAYMLLDVDAGRAEWRRVEYDIGRAQAAIVAAGLPRSLGLRLFEGR